MAAAMGYTGGRMTETELSDIVEIENVWITMSDGCRIAARIWLPCGPPRINI